MSNKISLTPIAKNALNSLINDAKIGDESRVTALWNTILPKFNITLDNGYSVNAEFPINDGIDNYRADIVVLNILKNNKVILIIECKSIKHDNIINWDVACSQLSNYLFHLNCNHGIIAVGHKFRFIKKENNYIPNVNSLHEYVWGSDLNYINDIYNKFIDFLNLDD
jgi:hypothetical protein